MGQVRIKTRQVLPDGSLGAEQEYKFGRATDGKEQALITPEGHRLLCFTGSHDEAGLRELGAIFVPKMERVHKSVGGATLTLCARARISFGVAGGKQLLALDSRGQLAAMAPEGAALLDSLIVLDGDGDLFAMRTSRKGKYLSVQANGTIGCKMSGWGAFSPNEMFEIVVEDSDDGHRVSVRAANGKLLGIDAQSGLVVADKASLLPDELFCVYPRSTEGLAALSEAANQLRMDSRSLEERHLQNRIQFRDRARACQRALVRTVLLEEGIQRLPLLATHVWCGLLAGSSCVAALLARSF